MQSIVHFDLKTNNLLISYRDRRPDCKVADFGLSKQVTLTTRPAAAKHDRPTLPSCHVLPLVPCLLC